MTYDVRVIIVCLYCVSASVMLSVTAIAPLKSILFTLLTSAALYLMLEKFSALSTAEGEE